MRSKPEDKITGAARRASFRSPPVRCQKTSDGEGMDGDLLSARATIWRTLKSFINSEACKCRLGWPLKGAIRCRKEEGKEIRFVFEWMMVVSACLFESE